MVLTKTKTFSHRWKLPSCNKPRSPFSFSGLWNENTERVHLTRFLIVFLVSDFPENTSGEDRAGLCVLLWTTSTGKSSQESMQWISPRLSIREFLILNRFISQRFIIFMHQIMIYRKKFHLKCLWFSCSATILVSHERTAPSICLYKKKFHSHRQDYFVEWKCLPLTITLHNPSSLLISSF